MFFLNIILHFIIYLGVSLVVYIYQRKLLYHPGENNYLDEGPFNHKIEKYIFSPKMNL